ncbi:hypothetical protein BH23CHL1_BH23CHL1_08700 [soil metagenome]
MQSTQKKPALLVGLVLVFMLLFAACGSEDPALGNSGSQPEPTATEEPASTPTPEPIAYPQGASDVVVRIEHTGGFVPQEFLVTRLPLVSLYGDGRILTEGPQIMIYPAPALPNLQMGTLNEEGIRMILKAAEEAGLLHGDKHYPLDMIADAATTVFTVTAGGETHTVSVYALDATGGPDSIGAPDLPADELEARKKLAKFQAKLVDYMSWLPETAITAPQTAYPIERLQVVSQPADLREINDIETGEAEWPLDTPLAEIGEPFEFMEQARCIVLEGDDLAAVLTALQDANQLTRWQNSGEEYSLHIRPILPDEQGCAQPQP